ncbi:hypothetical protein Dimus_037129, partial [Dionaea muscipula]
LGRDGVHWSYVWSTRNSGLTIQLLFPTARRALGRAANDATLRSSSRRETLTKCQDEAVVSLSRRIALPSQDEDAALALRFTESPWS